MAENWKEDAASLIWFHRLLEARRRGDRTRVRQCRVALAGLGWLVDAVASLEVVPDDREPRPDGRVGQRPRTREVDAWLESLLTDGPKASTTITAMGQAAGYTYRQLHQAKDRIGGQIERRGFGAGSQSFWLLPAVANI